MLISCRQISSSLRSDCRVARSFPFFSCHSNSFTIHILRMDDAQRQHMAKSCIIIIYTIYGTSGPSTIVYIRIDSGSARTTIAHKLQLIVWCIAPPDRQWKATDAAACISARIGRGRYSILNVNRCDGNLLVRIEWLIVFGLWCNYTTCNALWIRFSLQSNDLLVYWPQYNSSTATTTQCTIFCIAMIAMAARSLRW